MPTEVEIQMRFGSLYFVLSLLAAPTAADDVTLEHLTKGRVVHGFRAEALYRDGADRPMGARFVHVRRGFTLDLLRIDSLPQAFTWVQTTPVSDQGEPHTREHLESWQAYLAETLGPDAKVHRLYGRDFWMP
jgi:hypothetical protein